MKRLISFLLAFITILLFTSSISMAQQSVANIQVTVKLQAGNVLVAQCVTDADGGFTFDFSQGLPAPASGTFIFEITSYLPGGSILSNASSTKPVQTTQTLTAKFTAKTKRPFDYRLKWIQLKTNNRGSFAVSGKSDS
ncbi:MAG: hypothetical protein WC879_18120 [Melioribacteraceae bacterium]